MDMELQDTLRSLCRGRGWSYGVFWRISRGEPRFLIVAENYCEYQFKPVVKKMINQVNVVGEGTIGLVAATGKHQWIHSNGNSREWSTNGADNTPGMLQDNNEWCYQFLSGIKSMVFVSLPSQGVVQFGSSQKIFEDLGFIDQVKSSFQKFNYMKGPHSEKNTKIHTPHYEFEAGISSRHFQTCYRNIIDSMYESCSNDPFEKVQCSTNPSTTNSMHSTQRFSNPFQRTSSTGFVYQCDAAVANAQLAHSSLSNNSGGIRSNADAWNKEVMHLPGLPCSSHSSYSSTYSSYHHHHNLHGGSLSFSSLYRSLGSSGEQLLDFQHASPSLQVFSNPMSTNNLNEESGPDDAKLIPFKDDAIVNENKVDGISSSHVTRNEMMSSFDIGHYGEENPMSLVTNLLSDNDFFNGVEMDMNPSFLGQDSWSTITMPTDINPVFSECLSELDLSSKADFDDKFFMEPAVEQLLDAVVSGNLNFASGHGSVDTNQCSTSKETADQESNVLFSESNLGPGHGRLKETQAKSQVGSWMDDSTSMNTESAVTNTSKRLEEAPKVVRKRARPGESTRPRPKDRQQIQDRVKELRELVPNSSKCSIDALLDRTIKHMLYLQSVTKYADKLKQADEPKMICEESGVVLKDNTSGNSNGATWAFEVAGQTMVCPIIVEDLSPPGQMLVEMLCEERGLFLEIADIIRSFGLTILKGVMEIRDSKIWARFFVEANRDVTRMDIFMSLVQLLQQTTHLIRPSEQQTKIIDRKACDLIAGKLPWQSQSVWPLSCSNNGQRSFAQ